MKRFLVVLIVLVVIMASGELVTTGSAQEATPQYAVTVTPTTGTGAEWRIEHITVEFPDVVKVFTDSLKPHGKFIIVIFDATNLGNTPTYFPYSDFELRDDQGRTFSFDQDASIGFTITDPTMKEDSTAEFQPDLTYRQAIVFDIAPDALGLVFASSDGT